MQATKAHQPKPLKNSAKNGRVVQSQTSGNAIKCRICQIVHCNDNDKLLQCERYEKLFCVKCLKMTGDVYAVMNKRSNIHCVDC